LIPNEVDQRLQRFIYHEMSLLDERRYAEWVDLFAEDGIYWVPAETDQADTTKGDPPDRASLVYDTKPRLIERVARLESPAMWSERPPSNVVRMVTNLRSVGEDDGARAVEGRLIVFQSRGQELNQYAGRVRYEFVETDGGSFQIKAKHVVLVNAAAHMRNLGFIL
jgi:3-phenylpropionate/cinnamic acid dioxygenase small subunit